ncbi:amino acid transporter [Streptococcus cristatus]|jgi:amino acid transporter|uniref:ABC-2 family transporter protein n=1 Tax=Streptococcus cristatus TaxID=45634 RepID=A0A3R9LCE6_STRCR|nr:amino acid transporter [Streptococcus cristatus]RKV62835.1 MAG: amino acid transporter [Streptococcus sp.]RSJ78440.1 ABC-2 family transporter protein [Streptococcus cristatus]RSJ78543.1 ABC-2 family transporter protein [Streptococcus cristatus]RSJ84491.1 ABC-2 family transporter protein [Streptococcus cristatus]RSJ84612.1 ABC-2 family transporter protein [Streptococcus cristatus]
MTLFKAIFKSVFNRRDVKIFLIFILLPLLVPLLTEFMDGTSTGLAGNFSEFLATTISTQYRLILPNLLFSLVISSVFKDEIDSGILFLYKDINRSQIFKAKLGSLLVVYVLFLLGTVMTSVLSYYGILFSQGAVPANFISEKVPDIFSTIFSLLSTISLNLITLLLVVMISVTSKTVQTVLTGVFFSLAASVAPVLIGINYLFPNGYADLSQENFPLACLVAVGISVLYILFFYIKGKQKFKHIEF